MGRVRRHLTYANVMATVTLFLVLAGGAAYAAGHLGKSSVGTKQLKKNAVTVAKIKKNAVTAAKIRNAAVTGAKVKAGGLQGVDISPTVPFGHVVHAARGHASIPIPELGVLYPLENPTFAQEAGQALVPVGGIEVEVGAGCIGPAVEANVIADQADPVKASEETSLGKEPEGIVANIEWEPAATVAGPFKKLLTITPFAYNSVFSSAPAAAVNHSLAIVVEGECDSGSGLNATFGGVDVIGNKAS
jgi:hypothetical protein